MGLNDERTARDLLQSVRRVTRQVELYPLDHPLTVEAVAAAASAVAGLARGDDEIVLTLTADAFYLNRALLPHASLEFNGLLREMQARGVLSITFAGRVSEADLYDLAAFVAGSSDDLPADGTIRLNESGITGDDGSTLSQLRRSYVGSLDALRDANSDLAAEGAFDLNSVITAVEGLLESSLDASSAALLLATVKSHDEYTFYHSVNSSLLALSAGRWAGLSDDDLVPIGVGAVLHDIGKVAVPSSILHHPGRLSDEQWAEVAVHPREGAQAILAAGGRGHEIAATIALEHHVRFDGGGYPMNRGKPHAFSRLVSVCDTYDAVTTRRAYRRAETPNRALYFLVDGAGGAYDPDMVRLFVEMIGVYPVGSILRLDDGALVVVTHPEANGQERPGGLVVRSAGGETLAAPEPIEVDPERVAGQVLPTDCGIDPSAYVDTAPVAAAIRD